MHYPLQAFLQELHYLFDPLIMEIIFYVIISAIFLGMFYLSGYIILTMMEYLRKWKRNHGIY